MAIGKSEDDANVREALAAVWRSWNGELRSLGHHLLRFLTAFDGPEIVVETDVGVLTVTRLDAKGSRFVGQVQPGARADGELKRLLGRRDVTLRVAPAVTLRPAVQIPLASKRVLRGALAYELERLTPTEPAKLYFDFIVMKRSSRLADVMLRVVHRAVLDEAIGAIHAADSLVANIEFAGDSVSGDSQAFPVDRAAWRRRRWRRVGNPVLAALAAVLIVVVALAGELRGERMVGAVNDEVAQAARQAAATDQLKHRIMLLHAQVARLEAQRKQRALLATLEGLSRALPDGTWLRELTVDGTAVHASGSSRNASDLVGLIDRSNSFTDAEFAAPIVRNPADGTDHFELTFSLARQSAR